LQRQRIDLLNLQNGGSCKAQGFPTQNVSVGGSSEDEDEERVAE